MRVLVVGVHFFSSFAWSIKRAFERQGYQVWEFDYRANPFLKIPKLRTFYYQSVMQRRLLKVISNSQPDLICIGKGELIRSATIASIQRNQDVPIVNWFPDPRLYAYPEVVQSLPFLTWLFTKNHENVQQAKLLGFHNVAYLPHCADIELHISADTNQDTGFRSEVAFVGACYLYRDWILSHLTDFNLKIWGRNWENSITAEKKPEAIVGREARGLDQAKVFRQSIVNVNTHIFDDVMGVNQRVFDICGSGGFQIVDYKEQIKEFFELGEEIETFESVGELKDKIRFYLKHEARARAAGLKAREKVMRGHTYDHRIRDIVRLALGPHS